MEGEILKSETRMKAWLAEVLSDKRLQYALSPRKDIVRGRISVYAINGNGEKGSKRPAGYRILTGHVVYPDLVGEIWIGTRRWDLFIEAVVEKGNKSVTHSFRQALQYKAIGGAHEIFRRRPEHVLVLITSAGYLSGQPLSPRLYWFERFAWANGMGILRRDPYTGRLLITLSEQEKYEVVE